MKHFIKFGILTVLFVVGILQYPINAKADTSVNYELLETTRYDWPSSNGACMYNYHNQTFQTDPVPAALVDYIYPIYDKGGAYLGPHGENDGGLKGAYVEYHNITPSGEDITVIDKTSCWPIQSSDNDCGFNVSDITTGKIYLKFYWTYFYAMDDGVTANYTKPVMHSFMIKGPNVPYFADSSADLPAELMYEYGDNITLSVSATNVAETDGYEWYKNGTLYQTTSTGSLSLGRQNDLSLNESTFYVLLKSSSGLTTQSTSCILKADISTFTPKCSGNLPSAITNIINSNN